MERRPASSTPFLSKLRQWADVSPMISREVRRLTWPSPDYYFLELSAPRARECAMTAELIFDVAVGF